MKSSRPTPYPETITIILWAAVAALAGAGCSDRSSEDGYIPHLRNGDEPRWGSTARPFREEEVLGAPGSPPGFTIPTALTVDSRGIRYILDEGACRVVMVSADGAFTGGFGRKGEGPGEFVDPIDIDRLSAGRIIVSDYGALRFSLFNTDGTFVRTIPCAGTPGDFVVVSGDRLLLTEQERVLFTGERMIAAREGARLIHRFDLGGHIEGSFGQLRDHGSMILTTFLNKIYIAPLTGDSLVVNYACSDQMEIWTSSGTLARIVHRNVPFRPREPVEDTAPPPPPLSGGGAAAQPAARRDVVLDILSTGVAVSPDGAFWAVVTALDPTDFPTRSLRPQSASTQRWALDLFAGSGEWLARQPMGDAIPFALLEWTADGLYLLNPNGDGTVRRYQVISSGG